MGISNLLSAMLNAKMRKKNHIYWKFTQRALKILKVLKKEGFLSHFLVRGDLLKLYFKYDLKKEEAISSLKRLTYKNFTSSVSCKELWKLGPKPGILVLDTSHGVVSDRVAKKKNLGGFSLFYIKR